MSEGDDIRRAVRSGVVRWEGGSFPGVPVREYKADDGSFEGVLRRHVAVPDTGGFDVRYFEIEPGGHSSRERHRHVHVVLCMRGAGNVQLGADTHAIGPGDVITVAPDCVHQFRNGGPEPFGFFCIVDRERDRPVPVKGE